MYNIFNMHVTKLFISKNCVYNKTNYNKKILNMLNELYYFFKLN